MNKTRLKTKKYFKGIPTPLSPSNCKLGGWALLRDPAAIFSRWRSLKKQTEGVRIDMRLECQANDNSRKKPAIWIKALSVLGVAVFVWSMILMHSSTLATQAVIHADEEVLVAMMDANPQALAHMLNVINVGE